MKAMPLFQNRKALLVTKHGKEKVIGPILKEALGLHMVLSENVDTDQFGTFCGEIERPDTQYNTAILKALKGLEHYPDMDIAISSEGSFVPHPDCPFMPVHTEIVLLIDKAAGLEIAGRYLTPAPNMKEGFVLSMKEAWEFAEIIGFPEYGIVLKASKGESDHPFISKDANTRSELEADLGVCFSIAREGKVLMQTDMRAHRNPFRMENIRLATLELVKTIGSSCPRCATPGFDVKEVLKGLPCSQCGSPTKSTLSHIYECKKCHYREDRLYPHGHQQEDPGYCDRCNP
jgi:hypothetical protein